MATCPRCQSADLVRIDLEPEDGTLRFSACRRCEHRWWIKPAEAVSVDLREVIQAVATPRP